MGSSPRVWGQVAGTDKEFINQRIIPHACGDKRDIHHPNLQAVGSSPRVWGQEDGFYQAEEDGRIIPTRVGTSLIAVTLLRVIQDHPHACGDKSL